MNKAYSIYLDFLRAAAACVVVFYHYSNQVANGAWADTFPKIGQEAVIIFFVLSGYVISYAAEQREKTPLEFVCKRLSRIYSVYLPSFAIALLCWHFVNVLGKAEVYNSGESLVRPLKTIALNLSFLNFNSFFPRVVPPGGGPYWSLTFEVFYYVIFFLYTYWRHPASLALICALCVFLGAGPVLLFPIWLLGCAAYRMKLPESRNIAWLIFITSLVVSVAIYQIGLRDILGKIGQRSPFSFSPHYTKDFLYFYIVGILVAANLVSTREICLHISEIPTAITRPIRFLAGVSFSMYLLHLPLMRLGEALIGDPFPYLLPTLTCLVIICTCHPIEKGNRVIFRWIYPLALAIQTKALCLFRR